MAIIPLTTCPDMWAEPVLTHNKSTFINNLHHLTDSDHNKIVFSFVKTEIDKLEGHNSACDTKGKIHVHIR